VSNHSPNFALAGVILAREPSPIGFGWFSPDPFWIECPLDAKLNKVAGSGVKQSVMLRFSPGSSFSSDQFVLSASFLTRNCSRQTFLQLKGLRFMSASMNVRFWCAGLLALAPFSVGFADETAAAKQAEEPGINLLDAARAGTVAIDAEGTGDGRMTIKVTNLTNRKLKAAGWAAAG
jgi:hypothetical protein